MIVKQFIDAGWHTVPLAGEIKRDAKGKKSIPQYKKNWRETYTKTFNESVTPLAGAITGAVSGVVAIDCDNADTYNLFKCQDPDYDFFFESKDKPSGGGTILYKYDGDLASFSLADNSIALDFYSDNGFVYLPTEYNYSKQPWKHKKLPELRELPASAKVLLATLAKRKPVKEEAKTTNVVVSNRLAPMLTEFIASKQYTPVLFKIITPKAFRDLKQYVKQGHIHPNDIPQGRGSEYLSKISAILGADISVSRELYTETMTCINSLWTDSMDTSRLEQTITGPMLDQTVTIDGEIVWQYDKHWEDLGFVATAMNGDYVESFFDDVKGVYYLVNYTVPYTKMFEKKNDCLSMLKTLTGRKLPESAYDRTKQLVRTDMYPSKEFGHIEDTDSFNLFRQTPELNILNYPETYESQYSRPSTIISYLQSLVPDDAMRAYLLSFLRTKLTTFNYSPVVLYMIGAHGSGKDTLISLISLILGTQYLAKPSAKSFLEHYNGWIRDKYFVQLDEYGNSLNSSSQKMEALGKIKTISGAPDMQIRAMRSDGANYRHSVTIVMTSNSNPLPLETEDRRVAYIKTPNRLDREAWVKEAGGISIVQDKMREEISDFCYYLATEIEQLHPDAYVSAPETSDKEDMIMSGLPTYQQITYLVMHKRFDKLEQLGHENRIDNFTMGWNKSRLSHTKLAELYDKMTDGQGDDRAITRILKTEGLNRQHSTLKGQNHYFYHIPELYKYDLKYDSDKFEPISQVDIDGID